MLAMDLYSRNEMNESYINNMSQQGVIIIKNIFNTNTIANLMIEINKVRQTVMAKVSKMERPLKTYSDIAERHPGRLDYRCGFKADIFNETAEPIIEVIKKLSPDIDFHHYWGVIPTESGAGPTDLHRDVYPILNKMEGQNLSAPDVLLPPYYFTVLIPLVEITKENGPTEFVKGSHLEQAVDEHSAEIFSPLLQPGDVVIFDGRTLHRGTLNQSKQEKLIAYMTFIANWYHDQTFTINNYLFPELAY